tara:strand:- start:570 stop:860 length:291 start_codon:yes stop_codon:yes gene_type:complete
MLVELLKIDVVSAQEAHRSVKIARIMINPSHVISIVEDNLQYHHLKESLMEAGVHQDLSISEVKVYNGSQAETLLVLGTPRSIRERLDGKKQLLRG